ncbi:MAG: hypothetical protein KBA30_04880, partial [Clostridia bacterium]|nr:hypothetical protein [Clostridia bacterium]
VLEHSQDRQSGGFSMHRAARAGGGRHSEVIPCLTGNMVWSLIRFGYLDDPRLQKGIDWITRFHASTTARKPIRRSRPTTGTKCAGVRIPATWASSSA